MLLFLMSVQSRVTQVAFLTLITLVVTALAVILATPLVPWGRLCVALAPSNMPRAHVGRLWRRVFTQATYNGTIRDECEHRLADMLRGGRNIGCSMELSTYDQG